MTTSKLASRRLGYSTPSMAEDSFPRERLIGWMREWSLPSKGSRRCVVFSLSREGVLPTDDHLDLTHVEAPAVHVAESERERIHAANADELGRAAEALCRTAGRRSTFFVRGHEQPPPLETPKPGEEPDPLRVPPRITFPFTLTPPDGVRDNYEGGELPSNLGVTATMQRHSDTSLRMSQMSQGQVIDVLLEHNRQLMSWNLQARELQMKADALIQDLADRKQERDIRAKEAAFSLAIKEEAFEVVKTQVVPAALAVVRQRYGIGVRELESQRAPSPELPAAPADGAIMAMLASAKIGPKQLGALLPTLSKEQIGALQPVLYALADAMSPEDRAEFNAIVDAERERRSKEKGT